MITRATIPLRKALCLCHMGFLDAFSSGKAIMVEWIASGFLSLLVPDTLFVVKRDTFEAPFAFIYLTFLADPGSLHCLLPKGETKRAPDKIREATRLR